MVIKINSPIATKMNYNLPEEKARLTVSLHKIKKLTCSCLDNIIFSFRQQKIFINFIAGTQRVLMYESNLRQCNIL